MYEIKYQEKRKRGVCCICNKKDEYCYLSMEGLICNPCGYIINNKKLNTKEAILAYKLTYLDKKNIKNSSPTVLQAEVVKK